MMKAKKESGFMWLFTPGIRTSDHRAYQNLFMMFLNNKSHGLNESALLSKQTRILIAIIIKRSMHVLINLLITRLGEKNK